MVITQVCLETLEPFQRSLILGYLLSDGYLRPEGSIQFENALDQSDFINWLWYNLEAYRTSTKPSGVTRIHKKTGKTSSSLRFYSRSCFRNLHPLFYSQGKKRISPSLQPFFDFLMLLL